MFYFYCVSQLMIEDKEIREKQVFYLCVKEELLDTTFSELVYVSMVYLFLQRMCHINYN